MESSLGLCLRDIQTDQTYPNLNETQKEVHFIKIEGVLGAVDLQESFWNYKKLFPMTNVDPSLPVSDWTIIDIDNFLKGNPHI